MWLIISLVVSGCASVGHSGLISIHKSAGGTTESVPASSCDKHRHILGEIDIGKSVDIEFAGEMYRIFVNDTLRESLLLTGPYIPILPAFLVVPFLSEKPKVTQFQITKVNGGDITKAISNYYIYDRLENNKIYPSNVHTDGLKNILSFEYFALGAGSLDYSMFLVSTNKPNEYELPLHYDTSFWFCFGVH